MPRSQTLSEFLEVDLDATGEGMADIPLIEHENSHG
jgi:hypothetical protein